MNTDESAPRRTTIADYWVWTSASAWLLAAMFGFAWGWDLGGRVEDRSDEAKLAQALSVARDVAHMDAAALVARAPSPGVQRTRAL